MHLQAFDIIFRNQDLFTGARQFLYYFLLGTAVGQQITAKLMPIILSNNGVIHL